MSSPIQNYASILRILLFGSSGKGKSSAANTFINQFEEFGLEMKAEVREEEEIEQKTVKLNSYSMTDCIKIFDILGWNPNYYTVEKFDNIINGKVEENQDLRDKKLEIKKQANPLSNMDVVIFVINKDVLTDKYLEALKDYYEFAKKSKLLFFLLTKVDQFKTVEPLYNSPDKEDNVKKIKTAVVQSNEFKSICKFVRQIIPEANILPMINYAKDDYPSAIQKHFTDSVFDFIFKNVEKKETKKESTFDIFKNETDIIWKLHYDGSI